MIDDNDIEEIADQFRHGPYKLEKADEMDLRWVAIRGRQVYGPDDAIPVEVKLSWLQKNPTGFWIVKDHTGARVGSCELLPLKKPTMNKMIFGDITESQITADDICSPQEMDKAKCLYIENVFALYDSGGTRSFALVECLVAIPRIISNMGFPTNDFDVYAMPVKEFNTAEGRTKSPSEKLLNELGFWQVAETGKQGYPFYCAKFTDLTSSLVYWINLQKKRSDRLSKQRERKSKTAKTKFLEWRSHGDACFVIEGHRIKFNYQGKLRDLRLRSGCKAHELLFLLKAAPIQNEELKPDLCPRKVKPYDFVRNINRQLNAKIARYNYEGIPENVEFIKHSRQHNHYRPTIPIKTREEYDQDQIDQIHQH